MLTLNKTDSFRIDVAQDWDKDLTRMNAEFDDKGLYFNPRYKVTNLPQPTQVINPGDRLVCDVWTPKIIGGNDGAKKSDEYYDFADKLPGNLYIGYQALPLVKDYIGAHSPCKRIYLSLDKAPNLHIDEAGLYRVPFLRKHYNTDLEANLGYVRFGWPARFNLLTFRYQ